MGLFSWIFGNDLNNTNNTKGGKAMLNLTKGGTLDLTKDDRGNSLEGIRVGCGWSMLGSGVDIDLSAAHFDASGKCKGVTYFGNRDFNGVKSSGDNTTGAGDGDDETLFVDFNKISKDTTNIVFFINIFSSGYSLKQMKDAYVNIYNSKDGYLYAKYDMTSFGDHRGLVMCEMKRVGNDWTLEMHGITNEISSASTVKGWTLSQLVSQ